MSAELGEGQLWGTPCSWSLQEEGASEVTSLGARPCMGHWNPLDFQSCELSIALWYDVITMGPRQQGTDLSPGYFVNKTCSGQEEQSVAPEHGPPSQAVSPLSPDHEHGEFLLS